MKQGLRTQFEERQYMVSRDFEIYYYSDTHMKNVANHEHDYYEFYFFLKGDVSLSVNTEQWKLRPGDIIVIPPYTHHHPEIHDSEIPYQRFIFWLKKDYCNYLGSLSEDYLYLMQHVADSGKYIYHPDTLSFQAISTKIIHLIEEVHTRRFAQNAKISLCVQDLVLTLNRCIYELETPAVKQEENDLCQNIMNYIENHLGEDISLELLAREFYVSKYYISHMFKENFGISIHQYLLKKRLDACRNAMLAGTAVTAVYLLYGFHDYSGFFRAFKKEYGVSPKEYIHLHQQTMESLSKPE